MEYLLSLMAPMTSATGVPPELAEWMLEARWRRLVGGMRSAGRTVGSLFPALAVSHRYMASTNSSHDSRPSLSTSESALSITFYMLIIIKSNTVQAWRYLEFSIVLMPIQYQILLMYGEIYH